jgi:serine/threonine protein kinase
MGLSSGSRLGPYEIQALLGAGGMGEVYLARDTKLRRDVAIKILPDLFTNNAERLARLNAKRACSLR